MMRTRFLLWTLPLSVVVPFWLLVAGERTAHAG
jgi:hypothetical protein